MNVPPELPPLGSSVPKAAAGRSFRALATYSWASILLSVAVNLLMPGMAQSSHTREEVLGKAIVQALFAVTGLLAGIIALFGIPKYGRKGLLWPALCGTCTYGCLLVAIALPTFNAARQRALQVRANRRRSRSSSRRWSICPRLSRISDSISSGFSFELPPEYTPLPADKEARVVSLRLLETRFQAMRLRSSW